MSFLPLISNICTCQLQYIHRWHLYNWFAAGTIKKVKVFDKTPLTHHFLFLNWKKIKTKDMNQILDMPKVGYCIWLFVFIRITNSDTIKNIFKHSFFTRCNHLSFFYSVFSYSSYMIYVSNTSKVIEPFLENLWHQKHPMMIDLINSEAPNPQL